MPTRNVVLTDRQESLIEALVQSGRYQNASDVLREDLRLIEDREVEEARKLEALRAAVQLGERAVASGDYRDFADPAALSTHLNGLSGGSARRTDTK
jgi:antitoxin ParD1/3/4